MDTMDYDGIRLKRMPFYEFEAISGPIIWVGRLFPFFLFIICFYIPIQMVIDITTERIAGIMVFFKITYRNLGFVWRSNASTEF